MPLEFTSTHSFSAAGGLKALIYGAPGTQKTRMVRTCPRPFLFFKEPGLLSLRKAPDIEGARCSSMADVEEMLTLAETDLDFQRAFSTLYVDGTSEIAEMMLDESFASLKDGRLAWPHARAKVFEMIRRFRDLHSFNVVMTFRMQVYTRNDSVVLVGPSLPGNKWGMDVPYEFDEVFKTESQNDGTGKVTTRLLTLSDDTFIAKDRSGSLLPIELPDINNIIKKIKTAK
jgi:hypothetical protein